MSEKNIEHSSRKESGAKNICSTRDPVAELFIVEELMTRCFFLFESYCLVHVGRPF
jgi:hypothetical protein